MSNILNFSMVQNMRELQLCFIELGRFETSLPFFTERFNYEGNFDTMLPILTTKREQKTWMSESPSTEYKPQDETASTVVRNRDSHTGTHVNMRYLHCVDQRLTQNSPSPGCRTTLASRRMWAALLLLAADFFPYATQASFAPQNGKCGRIRITKTIS